MFSAKVYTAFIIIPILISLIYKKNWTLPLKVIFYYCLFTLLINFFEAIVIWTSIHHFEWIEPILAFLKTDNTTFLSILYYVKDFILLAWFFSLIYPSPPINRYIFWSGIILAIGSIINYLFIEGYREFGIFNPGADGIFIVALPILYLWTSQRQSLRISLKKNPYLWISLGLLFPNLLSLFLYFTGDYLYKSDIILYYKFFIAKNIFEIIGLILIAIGFSHARYARFISIPNQEATKIGS